MSNTTSVTQYLLELMTWFDFLKRALQANFLVRDQS